MHSGLVTLGDMRRAGMMIELCCENCSPHRHMYVTADTLPLPDLFPVPALKDVLRCAQCGAKNTAIHAPIWARPNARSNSALGQTY